MPVLGFVHLAPMAWAGWLAAVVILGNLLPVGRLGAARVTVELVAISSAVIAALALMGALQ